ncbi:hypothetical protein M413DRAFT_24764 [Hebeloma cylindrosporum]|uniref:Wax synthase domain-containing protein n=1 Tax=Hebeloma cylindrosporum TaxID=76867 RepID=A0A0C2YXC6_HEBCY|nr:hypothetical protein M413DRAFT_24764 [Hebeloma cylindrosporum h7]
MAADQMHDTMGFSSSRFLSYTHIPTLFILTTTDYILLRHHQPELRKIGQKKSTSDMTTIEQVAWAASLLATPRGIGWTHEPTAHLPAQPTASRRKFIAFQFLWIIFYGILFDITLIHIQGNPCFSKGGPSLAAFGWWWRTTVWVNIVSLYCTLSGVYASASIVSVAIGLYEPKDWCHLFGSPLDAYTSDSRVWHQALRKSLTSNSNFLASAFNLPRGTFATYFKLFTSFFISGLIHAAPDYIFHQNFSNGKAVQFFVLQAVVITFEDTVIAIASGLGYKESKSFKLIGLIWVFAWFTFCMPMYLDPTMHAGMMDEANHVSLIQGLIRVAT